MRIKTLLYSVVLAAMAIVVGMALVGWLLTARLTAISQTQVRAQIAATNVADLLVLTHEYALYAEERVKQQWVARQAQIAQTIELGRHGAISVPVETIFVVKALDENFQLLVSTGTADSALNGRQVSLLLSQLLTNAQTLSDAVRVWSDEAERQRQQAERRLETLATTAPIVILCVLILLAAILVKRVLRPLDKLHQAVKSVAKGDLTVRSATGTHDEFGRLSETFDAMAVDLVSELRTEIAQHKTSQADLSRFKAIIDSADDAIISKDMNGLITSWNPAATKIYGYSEAEAIGQPVDMLIPQESRNELSDLWVRVENGEPVSHYRAERVCKDGTRVPMLLSLSPIKGAQGGLIGIASVGHNISDQIRLEKMVTHMAFYDTLTNLPNRRMLNDRLGQTLAANKRSGRFGALMFVDLDNFKLLNDAHGHQAGDLLLIEVGQRLKACVREMDTVARIGGDEFVVMIAELDGDLGKSTLHAGVIADKIRAAIAALYTLPLQVAGREAEGTQERSTLEHHCTASIGVVLFPQGDGSPDDLLKWADASMYDAKAAGRNTVRFFEI